jgi:membrane protein implicated in regulation of membrane protease activity
VKWAAFLAVQGAMVALVLGDASVLAAATAGIAATALLLVAFTGPAPGFWTLMVCAAVAGAPAYLVTTVPVGPRWWSLLGPVAVVVLFCIAVAPYVRKRSTAQNRRML